VSVCLCGVAGAGDLSEPEDGKSARIRDMSVDPGSKQADEDQQGDYDRWGQGCQCFKVSPCAHVAHHRWLNTHLGGMGLNCLVWVLWA